MTAKEIFKLEDFDLFISEYQDKFFQYSNEETVLNTFFKSNEKVILLFKKWKNGEELFENEKTKAFPNPFRFE